jgi:predicted PurR-regulated permease PerM
MPSENLRPAPWKDFRKYSFPLLWAVLIGFLFLLSEVLAPILGALLIAYLLAPLVSKISKIKFKIKSRAFSLPRWVTVLLIYSILGLFVWGYGMLAVPRISAEFGKLAKEGEKLFLSLTPEKIEEYSQDIKRWVEDSGLPVQIVTPDTQPSPNERQPGFVINLDEIIRKSVADFTQGAKKTFFTFLKVGPAFAVKLFRNVLMMFLILMVTAFFLIDPKKIIDFMRSLFPERLHQGFKEIIDEIDKGLAGVVRGQVLICLVNGILTFIGLLILGVKYPVMLSTLAAVLSLIPIFGSILSSIPIVLIALSAGVYTGLGTLGWIIGIHLLEANFLNPKIIGESAKIHPVLVIFVLLAGEHFYGLLGALFAVPVASVGIAIFRVFHRRAIAWNKEEVANKQETKALDQPEQGQESEQIT